MEAALSAYAVDCDKPPYKPPGWHVLPSSRGLGGVIEWDMPRVEQYLELFVSEYQKTNADGTPREIAGETLRGILGAYESCLRANVLDFLLAHQHLIPAGWKKLKVFFWGTLYQFSGIEGVRYLFFDEEKGEYDWHWRYLGAKWSVAEPAILMYDYIIPGRRNN